MLEAPAQPVHAPGHHHVKFAPSAPIPLLIAVSCIALSDASANGDPMNIERMVTPPGRVGGDTERLDNLREGLDRMRRLREKMSQQEINEANKRAEKWLQEFHR